MNREPLSCSFLPQRNIDSGSERHKEQLDHWTTLLLSRTAQLPAGQRFIWSRGSTVTDNTAYLFDAALCNIQYAQIQLQKSSSCAGKQAYICAHNAASAYAKVLTDIVPKWTFIPSEVLALPDTHAHDMYGHYCLSRAIAYQSVGKADLLCNDSAQEVAAANAAHMFTVAAQLIDGDTTSMLARAQECTAQVLCLRGKRYLQQWDDDQDPEGAAKALACYQEAHERFIDAGMPGCQNEVDFAYERNQVHWLNPVLPNFKDMLRPRITPLR